MDAPEEPLPPVIYTMENKPIVTCECPSAREGAAAVAGGPARARRPLGPLAPRRAAPWMEVWPGRRRRTSVPRATSDPGKTPSRAVSCSLTAPGAGALPRLGRSARDRRVRPPGRGSCCPPGHTAPRPRGGPSRLADWGARTKFACVYRVCT